MKQCLSQELQKVQYLLIGSWNNLFLLERNMLNLSRKSSKKENQDLRRNKDRTYVLSFYNIVICSITMR